MHGRCGSRRRSFSLQVARRNARCEVRRRRGAGELGQADRPQAVACCRRDPGRSARSHNDPIVPLVGGPGEAAISPRNTSSAMGSAAARPRPGDDRSAWHGQVGRPALPALRSEKSGCEPARPVSGRPGRTMREGAELTHGSDAVHVHALRARSRTRASHARLRSSSTSPRVPTERGLHSSICARIRRACERSYFGSVVPLDVITSLTMAKRPRARAINCSMHVLPTLRATRRFPTCARSSATSCSSWKRARRRSLAVARPSGSGRRPIVRTAPPTCHG